MGTKSVSFQYTSKSGMFKTPHTELCDIREDLVGMVEKSVVEVFAKGSGTLNMVTHSSGTTCSIEAFNISQKQWDEIFKSKRK